MGLPTRRKPDSFREPSSPEDLAEGPLAIRDPGALRWRRAPCLLRERLYVVLPREMKPHSNDGPLDRLREGDGLALVVGAAVPDLQVVQVRREQRIPRRAPLRRADGRVIHREF